MEMITLLLFGLVLAVCIAADLSILYALAAGLVIFCGYARMKGFGPRRIALMLVSGIKTAKNILIVFLLIGMLTALWRACGTMPVIICYAVAMCGVFIRHRPAIIPRTRPMNIWIGSGNFFFSIRISLVYHHGQAMVYTISFPCKYL